MAESSWGNLVVNDAHVHFFSHRFYSALAKQRGVEDVGGMLGWQIPEEDPNLLAQRWVQELDRAGVRRAALIASIPGDEDSVATAVSSYPERFAGYFMLDPTQSDAVERVSRAAENKALHCICLFPAMHRYSVGDPLLKPVLEIASTSRLAVFVHCGVLSVGVRKKLGLPSLFDITFSNPLHLHPVALRFPEIRFVIPHFGAGMLREALMVADLCPNVWLDTSSSNAWMRYEGLDLKTVFRRALDVVGARRLLFGSDSSFFPRGWNVEILDAQIGALTAIGVSGDEARQIFGLNLEALVGLRQPMVSVQR
jgi:hypothetical protein